MGKLSIVALAALLAAAHVPAHAATDPHAGHGSAAAAPAATAFTAGEVRKVDKDAQKVTLRHGPIPNLGMGNMTMVFRVADPRWLDAVKAGDKVNFKADNVGGQYTVTAMEVVK